MSKFSVKELMNTDAPAPANLDVPARSIEQITVEINFYKTQTVQSIIEIGRRLTEAKAQLPHGGWSNWLKDGVDLSERVAQNFMRISREFSNTNPDSFLPYSKLLLLLQVPTEDRSAFMASPHIVNGEEKSVSDMSKRELEQAIKERDAERMRAIGAANREKKYKQEADENYKKYMTALAEKESVETSSRQARDSLAADKQLLQAKLKAAEEQKTDPIQLRKIREEAEINARAMMQEELDNLKKRSAGAMLDPEVTKDAADAFKDAVDAAFMQFESIINCSDSAVVVRCLPVCIGAVWDVYREMNKLKATSQNLLLMSQDADLPDNFDQE